MSTAKQEKVAALDFRPVDFQNGEKLSNSDYERRRNLVTKEKLNELLTSKEYKKWINDSARNSTGAWRTEACVICVGLIVGCLVAKQPQPVRLWERASVP